MKRLSVPSILSLFPALLILIVLQTGGVTHAAPVIKGTWQVVSSPNVCTDDNHLNAVAALTTTNIWAVGYSSADSNAPAQALIEHWDGTQWSVVSTPNLGSGYNEFNGVAASSSKDVWAVGYSQGGLVEHWNGIQWSIVLNQSFNFTAVTALSHKDIWAVGYILHNGSQRPFIEHWTGKTWAKSPNPYPGSLSEARGVTAITSHNVWVVGYNAPNTLSEHWNGNTWHIIATPDVGSHQNFLLAATHVPGTTQVIAVGYYYVPNGDPESIGTAQTLVEAYS